MERNVMSKGAIITLALVHGTGDLQITDGEKCDVERRKALGYVSLFPPTGRRHLEYAGDLESEVRFPCSRQFFPPIHRRRHIGIPSVPRFSLT
ncbi:hypothetical protein J6590_069458 [Homalodisca vitripennis]|nr:hypothetical protein J6590_069458 [Homalodisca vitripennis]